MRRRAHSIGAWLRRRTEQAKDEAKTITGEMATIAELSIGEALVVARNARRGLRKLGDQASGKAIATVDELDTLIGRMGAIIDQTRQRLAGTTPSGATRVVSLHDPDARPIMKGRMGKPVEFGYLAQVMDNADGVIVDHSEHIGNPYDGPLLAPAVARLKRLIGRAPNKVTADRGYGDTVVDAELETLGVKHVAIVRKGRPSAARQRIERRPAFRRLIKWRTGCEGRIAALKRNYGWNRTLMDGVVGAQTWCGYGVFAHNSVKISGLLYPDPSAPDAASAHTPTRQRPPPRSQPPPCLPISA
jgi:IS5 family transposase